MANARGKTMDNTHLSIDQAETRGFIHRDYIAHCLRWSHVAKFMGEKSRYKTADLLDIGCGKDLPLLRLLYSSKLIPDTGSYTGIDINKLEAPFNLGRYPHELVGQTDVCEWNDNGSTFAVITCFEVLEHVEPEHSFRILQRIASLLEDDGRAFFSTPCYDASVGAAGNHVNEMSFDGLHALIDAAGLEVVQVNGTFASIRDYQGQLEKDGHGPLFNRLRGYYDTNYLATIFAPLYPHLSRNAIWRVRKPQGIVGNKHELGKTIPALADAAGASHSSSDKWTDFINQLLEKQHG